MGYFRKKPVTIEARQFTGAGVAADLIKWCGGKYLGLQHPEPAAIAIATLEGTMLAHVGDWIIKGVQGEFYPCKPDIFAQTYESVGALA